MEEEVVSILVNVKVFNEAMQFLSTQPFNQVAGLIQNLGQSPGLFQSHLDKMNKEEPDVEV